MIASFDQLLLLWPDARKGSVLRSTLLTLLLAVPVLSGCGDSRAPDLEAVKQEIREKFPDVDHIPIDQLADWILQQRAILLVDVREKSEFEISHLENAIHSQQANEIHRLFEEGNFSEVVVYCSVGYRSAEMARLLGHQGLRSVFNLEGSIFEWANQDRPVHSSAGPVEKVHPYDAEWGKLLRRRLRAPLD